MRVIARKALRDFWEIHPDAEDSLRSWFREAEHATWSGPSDVKQRFSTASFIAGDRIVFNIKGNSYRLIVAVKYASGIVFIRFVGTHAQYDRINAAEV
jgi:mRNA interferase HigB